MTGLTSYNVGPGIRAPKINAGQKPKEKPPEKPAEKPKKRTRRKKKEV